MTGSEIAAEFEVRFADGTTLNLMGWNTLANGAEVHIQVQAKGSNFGDPAPLRQVLRTAMLDGSRSALDGHDNRTFPLRLRITGPDGNALAGVELPLFLLAKQPAEMVWRPGVQAAEAAVFVLDYADLNKDPDPDFGDGQLVRDYTLQVAAQPFTYSDEYVTIPAIVQGSSTPTLVDDCTSLTGWTGTNAVLSLEGTGIRLAPTTGALTFSATLAEANDLTTEPYLGVHSGHTPVAVEVLNGTIWTALSLIGYDNWAYIYDGTDLADPTVDAIRITHSSLGESPGYRNVNEITKQATPRAGATRQQVRTLEVPGSARTPATLLVESPTLGAGLGTTFLYTGPNYNPDLSRGALDARVAAVGRLSGAYSVIDSGGNGHRFEIPASEFHTGDHALYAIARVRDATATGLLTVTAEARTPDGYVIATEEVAAARIAGPSIDFDVHLLGSAVLPQAALPDGSEAVVRFTLEWLHDGPALDPELAKLEVDTVLAFNRTVGGLTVAEVGDFRSMWVEPPTLRRDHPAVFVGNGDRAEAVPLSLRSQLPAWPGTHEIESPVTYLYTGTTGVDDTEVSGTFRPAHFLHPAV